MNKKEIDKYFNDNYNKFLQKAKIFLQFNKYKMSEYTASEIVSIFYLFLTENLFIKVDEKNIYKLMFSNNFSYYLKENYKVEITLPIVKEIIIDDKKYIITEEFLSTLTKTEMETLLVLQIAKDRYEARKILNITANNLRQRIYKIKNKYNKCVIF